MCAGWRFRFFFFWEVGGDEGVVFCLRYGDLGKVFIVCVLEE